LLLSTTLIFLVARFKLAHTIYCKPSRVFAFEFAGQVFSNTVLYNVQYLENAHV